MWGKPKTTVKISLYGPGAETTKSWLSTTDTGPRFEAEISTSDPERDLPLFASLIRSNPIVLPQPPETKLIEPEFETVDVEPTYLLPTEKKPTKRGWFG